MFLCLGIYCVHFCFFFKQKTAYEMRISDWSSDVCSSDLSFELLRFCHAGMQLVSGGLGKLLSAFAAAFQPDDIMTYLDMEWPGGEAFLKNGFTPAGTLPPQIFWINPDDGIRYYPGRLPAALQGAGPEGFHGLGFYRVYNT